MLLAFVFVVIGITLYQERKTERALEALRDLSSPRALVIRDGEQRRIAGREVVRGDLVVLRRRRPRAGRRRAARSRTNLARDESLLTGESVPVRKSAERDRAADGSARAATICRSCISGTLVVQGKAIARGARDRARTEIGKIGKALATVEIRARRRCSAETAGWCKLLAVVGARACALVAIALRLHARATGSTACSPASRSPWRCCRRSSRSS